MSSEICIPVRRVAISSLRYKVLNPETQGGRSLEITLELSDGQKIEMALNSDHMKILDSAVTAVRQRPRLVGA